MSGLGTVRNSAPAQQTAWLCPLACSEELRSCGEAPQGRIVHRRVPFGSLTMLHRLQLFVVSRADPSPAPGGDGWGANAVLYVVLNTGVQGGSWLGKVSAERNG